jgi:hypothetical protein
MTSILGIPACYALLHNNNGTISVYVEGKLLGSWFSEDEAKWNATQHYFKNKEK